MKKIIRKIKIEDILTIILLLYPLRNANRGIDLMDAGYSLGNFRFYDSMNEMWKMATYLANVCGMLLSRLPFGDTWIGMNCYTGLMVGITAAISYRFLLKNISLGSRKYLLFIAELTALSLCWAPTTILYHYMGYILMTFAILCLYQALTKEKNRYFLIAGLILGANVLVRMPNITHMALIVGVWYYAFLKKTAPKKVMLQTGCCIAGYAAGLGIPFLWVCIRYGFSSYLNMITSLASMTDTATDYKPTSMLMAMFEDYIQYSVWLLLMLVYLLFGLVLFHIAKDKWIGVKKVIYLAGMLVLLRLFYGRGMFNFDYKAYFSMYKWVTVYLLVSILLLAAILFKREIAPERRLWAVLLLVLIFVTPLGSNNGLYPLMNNLFLLMPATAYFLLEEAKTLKKSFAGNAVIYFLLVCVSVQSILFGVFFHLHDNVAGDACNTKLTLPAFGAARGMRTTVDKAAFLEELGGYLAKEGLADRKLILYGEIPALSYLFDMEPAIYTTWADLPSNDLKRLVEGLDRNTAEIAAGADKPLIIVTSQIGAYLTEDDKGMNLLGTDREKLAADKKLAAIADYIEENGYLNTYDSEAYCVFQ